MAHANVTQPMAVRNGQRVFGAVKNWFDCVVGGSLFIYCGYRRVEKVVSNLPSGCCHRLIPNALGKISTQFKLTHYPWGAEERAHGLPGSHARVFTQFNKGS